MGVIMTDAAERPSSRVSRPLVIAAAAFAASTVCGSVVAARGNVEGAPFGVKLPISVPTGLLVGWGSGLSAPWPMPVVALIAALRGGQTAGRICAAIGAGVIVGTVIEPVTWSYTPLLNHIVMIGTLGSGAALIREGWRASHRRRVGSGLRNQSPSSD
jgi:hypothetical protein